MVMFKAKFQPMADRPTAGEGARMQRQQQQQPQPTPKPQNRDEDKAPPIEKEQGPQVPIELPGEEQAPQRAR